MPGLEVVRQGFMPNTALDMAVSRPVDDLVDKKIGNLDDQSSPVSDRRPREHAILGAVHEQSLLPCENGTGSGPGRLPLPWILS